MKTQIAMALFVLSIWSCNSPKTDEAKTETDREETPAVSVAQRPVEFADEKFSQSCKDAMMKLSAGDTDGFTNMFSDNAVYRWNNGDSLAGKPAIVKYWTDRRKNVITKLEFTDDVWLSLSVTDANEYDIPKGNWVLSWYTTHATYATGKSIQQSMHMLFHFNADGKVDEVIHYLDRGDIRVAAGK